MGKRIELQSVLEEVLGSGNVYYQPPESIRIQYPAIVYERDNIENDYADNTVYAQHHTYQVTVIDADPDSEIVDRVSKIPTAYFMRHYVADNLNHDAFRLYY